MIEEPTTISTLSERGRAFIDAVIAAYDKGGSYDTVARELGTKSSAVQTIMRRFSPDSIRSPDQALKTRPQSKLAEQGLTLIALGLYAVGPCKGTRFSSCGIPLVAKRRDNPVKGQTCGLCLAFASAQVAKKDERQYVAWYARKYDLGLAEARVRIKGHG